jgi:hypothetical protein
MKYDTLMPKDIEPYLNGRSWEDLKVGDEIAFPEPDSGPTGEILVGLTFYLQQDEKVPDEKVEMTCTSFDAKTGMHTIEGGPPPGLPPLNLRELPDEAKNMITFEGSDAYFATDLLGLCTIGELGVCSSVGGCALSSVLQFEAISRSTSLIPHLLLSPFLPFSCLVALSSFSR